jgi:ribonuclease HI
MDLDNLDTVICQLAAYGRRHSDIKGQFAATAAKYLGLRKEFGRVYEGMLSDPLLVEIIEEAQLEIACGWRPPAADGGDAIESPGVQTIYCDGCCLGNGREGARAGYGIHTVDAGGAGALSEAFRVPADDPQTNQRAELLALRYALTIASAWPAADRGRRYEIRTDSRYAIDCLTKWSAGWEASGWRRADNKPVLHADIIKDCLVMFRRLGDRVQLLHVAAHTGGTDVHSRGNAVADRLAREGAELSLA